MTLLSKPLNKWATHLLSSALFLAACAPSVDRLLADHHFAEAICATNSAIGGDEAYEPKVLAAFEHQLDPRFNIQAVTRSQLVRLIGEAAPEIYEQTLFLRLAYDLNGSDLSRVAAEVRVFGPVSEIKDERQAFAALTDEKLPQPITVNPSWSDEAAYELKSAGHTAGILAKAFMKIITVGLWPVRVGKAPKKTKSRVVSPSDRQYACKAPVAETLYQRFVSNDIRCETGRRCTQWFFYQRRSALLKLRVRIEYSGDFRCDRSLSHSVTLRLPPGDPADAINRMFSDRMLTLGQLRELARNSSGAAPSTSVAD